jgi:hypothetical protein
MTRFPDDARQSASHSGMKAMGRLIHMKGPCLQKVGKIGHFTTAVDVDRLDDINVTRTHLCA